MSLIIHDGYSFNCGNCVSDDFGANTGIWCHFDDVNITEIGDLPKGFYTRESHKKNKNKNIMSG